MNLFFFNKRNPVTNPPTEAELFEDRRNESLSMVLHEFGLNKIDIQMKWLDNRKGLHLFVRLSECSTENWTALHRWSDQIRFKLLLHGICVNEIFYSHNSNSQTGQKELNERPIPRMFWPPRRGA